MATRGNPIVGMRLEPSTVARIDWLAGAHGMSRGEIIVRALQCLPDWADSIGGVYAQQLPGQICLEDVQQPQK
jgi:hypothetical protein